MYYSSWTVVLQTSVESDLWKCVTPAVTKFGSALLASGEDPICIAIPYMS